MAKQSETALALKRLREETGLSVRETADAIEWKQSTYSHYEDKFKGDYLPGKLVNALAPVFEPRLAGSTRRLMELAGLEFTGRPLAAKLPPQSTGDVNDSLTIRTDSVPSNLPRDLPVLGHAKGGKPDFYEFNGELLATVERPPKLMGVPKAYAVWVSGTSMEPRFFDGETVYVHPTKPLRAGRFVVIQLQPKEEGEPIRGLIKQYVRQDNDKWVFKSLNPPNAPLIQIAKKEVLTVHLIVGSAIDDY